MQTYIATLIGQSPISFGRYHNTEKKPREAADDFEERTWHMRLHTDSEGNSMIPPMAFKNCLSMAAKKLGMPVPGKARRTFTAIFLSGIMVVEHAPVLAPEGKKSKQAKLDDYRKETLFVSANGKSGQGTGTRVMRHFPTLDTWVTQVEIHVVDPAITHDILLEHLDFAGKMVGVGRFRPENGGFYGRFKTEALELVSDDTLEEAAE